MLAWIGIALHLPVGFFYLSSGLVAPLWAIVVLIVWWFVLLYFAVRERVRRPWWSLGTPLVAFATWFAFLSFGEAVLGWQA